MVSKEAIKQLCEQPTSSITVNSLQSLLKEAGIRCTLMGYYSWGSFSNAQVLFVIDEKGYIARRSARNQNSPVIFNHTDDGKKFNAGNRLTDSEVKVFKDLGM